MIQPNATAAVDLHKLEDDKGLITWMTLVVIPGWGLSNIRI